MLWRRSPKERRPGVFYGRSMGKQQRIPAGHRIERFCQEYVIDNNATRAATSAGYSAKTANQQGSRLLANVKVKARIEQLRAEIAARNAVTVDRVLKEYARLGFYDARKFFDSDGRGIAIQDLDDDSAAVIAGITVFEEYERDGSKRVLIGHTKTLKLTEKKGALDSMSRVLGMFEKDNAQGTNALKEMFDVLNASRPRKGLV